MKPATSDDVFDLMDSYMTSAAVNAALELGLFWMLAKQRLDASSVAKELNIPPTRCLYWLQLLTRLGLLKSTPEGYAPSPAAQKAIIDAYTKETWSYLAKEERAQYPLIIDFTDRLRDLGSPSKIRELNPPDYSRQTVEDTANVRRFTRMLYELHLPLSNMLAESLDMSGVRRLLDIGGGSGVMSMALLRKHPQLTALVLDVPDVCISGREIAIENSLQERILYKEADICTDELPEGFDMVLECDVNIYTVELFKKVKAILNPGGRLVVVDQFAPSENAAPETRLTWAFQSSIENPDPVFLSSGEIGTRLKEAGYRILSERGLPHSGVWRWTAGWNVVEAGNTRAFPASPCI